MTYGTGAKRVTRSICVASNQNVNALHVQVLINLKRVSQKKFDSPSFLIPISKSDGNVIF